ncbi:MAG: wyosine biosynthesis protein TYW1 [Candidatus Proteinoplasmatales archaeon SG8-5]|nr:MAG: wyosine biosynthesis protein TYW1 [Candidatus Proteinoplasmatales archaeon SG8-5]
MDERLSRILEKQHYHIVGSHSGVKLCHWLGEKLLRGRSCYKETFYGIRSHRCLQMSPAVNNCTQSCLFCWRYQGLSETGLDVEDDPESILEGAIEGQRRLVTGYKGDPRTTPEMWAEASEPNMVAISLAGEPTLYGQLGGFIDACNKRGMTTFLVTNGTEPEALERLDPLPTQLYVTLAAPNEEVYRRLCVPLVKDGWQRLIRTLELLPDLNTRTVIRHTLVDGWNIGWEKEYARLIETADPMFVEPKGYVFVGYSRERMRNSNMPAQETVRAFSDNLAKETGYEVLAEQGSSRVVLLGKDKRAMRIGDD